MAATSPLLASGPLGLTCRHASASRAAGHPSSSSLPSSQEELESKAALLKAALQAALPGLLIREAIASGGISICFEALDRRSGELRAVKVTHQGVSCGGSANLVAKLAEEEASAYALFEDKHPQPYGIPLTYQTGHLTIDKHEHYFLVMQRLGPDLESLILDGTISRRTFLQYALGMLKAVQSLHLHNLVHLDVKPRNFCAAHSPVSKAAGSWQQRLQVYVIDLEGSKGIPDEEQAHWEDEFFGTVDYAGSTALLQCMAGPCDDVESLCYSYLHMWLGRVPWSVTKDFAFNSKGGWSNEDLKAMLALRQRQWDALVAAGEVPRFLQRWLQYAHSQPAHELPDYARLRAILHSLSKEPATQPDSCPAALHYVDDIKRTKEVISTPPRKRPPSKAAAEAEPGHDVAEGAAAVSDDTPGMAEPPRKRHKQTPAANAAHLLQPEE